MNWKRCSGVLAHQPLDQVADRLAVLIFGRQGDPNQRAGRGVHSGFLELVRVHFRKPLEPRDLDFQALETLFLALRQFNPDATFRVQAAASPPSTPLSGVSKLGTISD